MNRTPHNCGWAPRTYTKQLKEGTPPLQGPINARTARHTSVDVRGGGLNMVRVVHISDTHSDKRDRGVFGKIPDGDVLIHSGDATNSGKHWEYVQFFEAMKQLP